MKEGEEVGRLTAGGRGGASPAAEERARRLAAAMRDNLKRRKAQARAREADQTAARQAEDEKPD